MPAPPEVPGDPDQIQQVCLNLIMNAIHAMPSGGTLRIATERVVRRKGGLDLAPPAEYAVLTIADSGPGHPGRRPREDLRAVLHHQGRGAGDRASAWRSATASSRTTTAGSRSTARPAGGADIPRLPALCAAVAAADDSAAPGCRRSTAPSDRQALAEAIRSARIELSVRRAACSDDSEPRPSRRGGGRARRILVVEDDAAMRDDAARGAGGRRLRVESAAGGRAGIERVRAGRHRPGRLRRQDARPRRARHAARDQGGHARRRTSSSSPRSARSTPPSAR